MESQIVLSCAEKETYPSTIIVNNPIIVILSSNSEEYVNVCMGLVEG